MSFFEDLKQYKEQQRCRKSLQNKFNIIRYMFRNSFVFLNTFIFMPLMNLNSKLYPSNLDNVISLSRIVSERKEFIRIDRKEAAFYSRLTVQFDESSSSLSRKITSREKILITE